MSWAVRRLSSLGTYDSRSTELQLTRYYSFGNQGAAQAQNLRDSEIPNDKIIVANRQDSYAEDAKSRGFNVEHEFPKAAKAADSK